MIEESNWPQSLVVGDVQWHNNSFQARRAALTQLCAIDCWCSSLKIPLRRQLSLFLGGTPSESDEALSYSIYTCSVSKLVKKLSVRQGWQDSKPDFGTRRGSSNWRFDWLTEHIQSIGLVRMWRIKNWMSAWVLTLKPENNPRGKNLTPGDCEQRLQMGTWLGRSSVLSFYW